MLIYKMQGPVYGEFVLTLPLEADKDLNNVFATERCSGLPDLREIPHRFGWRGTVNTAVNAVQVVVVSNDCDGFTPKEVNTPQAVFDVSDERQPARPTYCCRCKPGFICRCPGREAQGSGSRSGTA